MDDNNITTVLDILQEPHEAVMEDYYNLGDSIYDNFDKAAYAKGNGYICPNYPIFNEKMEGLEEGLYIFAGESNSGKSAILTNIIWDYCMCPKNKLFGIYFSLDDSTNEIIPRLIAMNQNIPISVGSKPQRYVNFINKTKDSNDETVKRQRELFAEYLDRRKTGLENLRNSNKNFLILDSDRITSLEQIIEYSKKVQTFVKSYDPENNIIVAIDSLADVTIESQRFNTEKEKVDYIAKTIKNAANSVLKVPIFTSYHLRKLNTNGRPTLDDVKESGRLVYEASVIFLVYNDVGKNGESANIFYSHEDSESKSPIIELHWAKNKKSSFKYRTYHYFTPDFSSVIECDKDVQRRYDAVIYTK